MATQKKSRPLPYITPDAGRINCARCRKYNQVGCPICHRCASPCCICRYCEECKKKHPRSTCVSCGWCKKKCTCKGRPKVLNLDASLEASGQLTESRRIVRPEVLQRSLGVEIEILHYSGEAPTNGFFCVPHKCVTDGTIRDSQGERAARGMEVVIGPMVGKFFGKGMDSIGEWLKSHYAQVNATCGLHVHVGAQDLSNQQVRQVIQVFKVLEGTFFSLVQPDRRSNQFGGVITPGDWKHITYALRETGGDLIELQKYLYSYPGDSAISPKDLAAWLSHARKQKRVPLRYKGLNIPGFFHQGTFEFRMHEGCVQMERIKNWAQWCGWFVELVSRLTPEEVAGISSPEDYLQGSWKRPGGRILSVPSGAIEYVRGGRDASPYAPAAVRSADAPPEPKKKTARMAGISTGNAGTTLGETIIVESPTRVAEGLRNSYTVGYNPPPPGSEATRERANRLRNLAAGGALTPDAPAQPGRLRTPVAEWFRAQATMPDPAGVRTRRAQMQDAAQRQRAQGFYTPRDTSLNWAGAPATGRSTSATPNIPLDNE